MSSKTKLPPRAVALSLTALVLVAGCLGAVAMLDYNASVDLENPIEYDETIPSLFSIYGESLGETVWTRTENANILYPSENDGLYMIDTGIADLKYFTMHLGEMFSNQDNDVRSVVVNTPLDMTLVRFWGLNGGSETSNPSKGWEFTEVSAGVWELEFSSADILYLKKQTGMSIEFRNIESPADGMFEFGVQFYGDDVPLFYAEYVLLFLGSVLILCAVFATPLLSPSDIGKAGQKIKSKVKSKRRRS